MQNLSCLAVQTEIKQTSATKIKNEELTAAQRKILKVNELRL